MPTYAGKLRANTTRDWPDTNAKKRNEQQDSKADIAEYIAHNVYMLAFCLSINQ